MIQYIRKNLSMRSHHSTTRFLAEFHLFPSFTNPHQPIHPNIPKGGRGCLLRIGGRHMCRSKPPPSEFTRSLNLDGVAGNPMQNGAWRIEDDQQGVGTATRIGIRCASIWPCLRGRWLTQWTLVQRCGSTSRRRTRQTVDVVEGICDAPLGLKKLDQVFDQRIWWGSSGEFDLGHIV